MAWNAAFHVTRGLSPHCINKCRGFVTGKKRHVRQRGGRCLLGLAKPPSLIEAGCPGTTTVLNLCHPKSTHCISFEITRDYAGQPSTQQDASKWPVVQSQFSSTSWRIWRW